MMTSDNTKATDTDPSINNEKDHGSPDGGCGNTTTKSQQQQQQQQPPPPSSVSVPPPPPLPTKPKQIKKSSHVGRADAKRDTILFVCFLACMMLVSFLTHDVGTNKGDDDDDDGKTTKNNPKAKTLAKIKKQYTVLRDKLLSTAEEIVVMDTMMSSSSSSIFYNSPPRMDCGLFLSASSIRGSGWGIFAGKNFTKGEVVMDMSGSGPWLPIRNGGGAGGGGGGDGRDGPTTTLIETHPYGLLLKPHNILANVQLLEGSHGRDDDGNVDDVDGTTSVRSALWQYHRHHNSGGEKGRSDTIKGAATTTTYQRSSSSSTTLVATQNVYAGQELFVRWEDHPAYVLSESTSSADLSSFHSIQSTNPLFSDLPTIRQYEVADSIIQDSIQQLHKKRTWSITSHGKHQRQHQQRWTKEFSDITATLQQVKKAVHRYDPIVAALLPGTVKELAVYSDNGGLSVSAQSLKNVSHPTLAVIGRCLTDVLVVNKKDTVSDADDDLEKNYVETSAEKVERTLYNKDTTTTTSKSSSSSQRVLVSRTFVQKGETILPVPLYIQDTMTTSWKDDDDTTTIDGGGADSPTLSCSSDGKIDDQDVDDDRTSQHPCLTLKGMGLSLCPLLMNGMVHTTRDPVRVNAQFQWSATFDSPARAVNGTDLLLASSITREDILQQHALSLSWDVVALQDIKANDEIIVLSPSPDLQLDLRTV